MLIYKVVIGKSWLRLLQRKANRLFGQNRAYKVYLSAILDLYDRRIVAFVIVTVSKMLGHAKVSTTEDIYSHVIEESKQLASNLLAEVFYRGS